VIFEENYNLPESSFLSFPSLLSKVLFLPFLHFVKINFSYFKKLVDILNDPSTSGITRFALETAIGIANETAYITVNVSDL
jgi:anionic cell wall polymer biosynthesis LytR-Cps2A-Psr (LCP) family protein